MISLDDTLFFQMQIDSLPRGSSRLVVKTGIFSSALLFNLFLRRGNDSLPVCTEAILIRWVNLGNSESRLFSVSLFLHVLFPLDRNWIFRRNINLAYIKNDRSNLVKIAKNIDNWSLLQMDTWRMHNMNIWHIHSTATLRFLEVILKIVSEMYYEHLTPVGYGLDTAKNEPHAFARGVCDRAWRSSNQFVGHAFASGVCDLLDEVQINSNRSNRSNRWNSKLSEHQLLVEL